MIKGDLHWAAIVDLVAYGRADGAGSLLVPRLIVADYFFAGEGTTLRDHFFARKGYNLASAASITCW